VHFRVAVAGDHASGVFYPADGPEKFPARFRETGIDLMWSKWGGLVASMMLNRLMLPLLALRFVRQQIPFLAPQERHGKNAEKRISRLKVV
jgi:hypothetical protein